MSDDLDGIFEKELLSDISGSSNTHNTKQIEYFRELCEYKLDYSQSSEKIANHEKFILIVDELNSKFPFFQIGEFIENFIDGVYNKDMIEKFNFSTKHNFEMCLRKMKLVQKRTKKSNPDDETGYARRANLKLTKNFQAYEFLINEIEFFENELNQLYNYNIARSAVILKFLNKKCILNEILKDGMIYDQEGLECFKIKFNEDIKKIIKDNFESILYELLQNKTIQFVDGSYSDKLIFEDFENSIKEVINDEKSGITYGKLVSNLIKKHNFVSMIPHYAILATLLEKYSSLGVITVESGFNKSGITDNRYFSIANALSDSFSDSLNSMPLIFFGRTNDSFRFIEDIQYLRKGDFDDEDDQITRIAGLILAGTQTMISEPEPFTEFDFAVNMSGFSPTPEQIKIMEQSKTILDPNCKIIHLKIMINEDVSVKNIESIQKILPKNEQAMIISFESISKEVTDLISLDNSIQIIDKKSLQLWAEITPEIPSRKGSVTKIMSGKHVGKIANLIHTNYETGKATIELIPSLDEEIEYIGFLKEINLCDDPVNNDHLTISQNYSKFLNILGTHSEFSEFQKAIFNFDDNIKRYSETSSWNFKERKEFRTAVDNVTSIINPNGRNFEDSFTCTCDHFKNTSKFCAHLLMILNKIGISNNYFSDTWGKDENPLFSSLNRIF